jgi:hypothetical protein
MKNLWTNEEKSIYILVGPHSPPASVPRHLQEPGMKVNIIMLDESQSHDQINDIMSSMNQENDSIAVANQSDFNICFGDSSFDIFEIPHDILEESVSTKETLTNVPSDYIYSEKDNESLDVAAGFDFSLFNVNPDEDPELAEVRKN